MKKIQRFWDLNDHSELLVHCPCPKYPCIYRAFPKLYIELLRRWNHDLEQYQFICREEEVMTAFLESFYKGNRVSFH